MYASSTVEDYLKCIHLVEHDAKRAGKDLVPMGEIAARLKVSPASVTAMMKTLSESGLIVYEPYSGVRLLPAGRKLAAHVLRRHRLVELFLVNVIGFDWSDVHAEAELLEHAVSERMIARMDEILGYPSVDPHGDPIPSADGRIEVADHPDLVKCELNRTVEVVRVMDQGAEFLRFAERQGLSPGNRIEVAARDRTSGSLSVISGDRQFSLGFPAAAKVLVRNARQPSG